KIMLEGAARRMRALTGYDRVTLVMDGQRVESSRGKMPELEGSGELPPIIADAAEQPVQLFPRNGDKDIAGALLRCPTLQQLEELRAAGVTSALCVPVVRKGETIGCFECDSRTER